MLCVLKVERMFVVVPSATYGCAGWFCIMGKVDVGVSLVSLIVVIFECVL